MCENEISWQNKQQPKPFYIPALRTVLLCVLITAMGGAFLIEQPGSSYMEFYDKMRWLYEHIPVICPNIKLIGVLRGLAQDVKLSPRRVAVNQVT